MNGDLKEKIRDVLRADPRLGILLWEILGPPVGARDSPARPSEE